MPLYVVKAAGASVDCGGSEPLARVRPAKGLVSIVRPGEVKSAWEKAAEQREAKLELIREQVQTGSFVIRKMTEEERRRYPPRPASPKRPGRR